MCLLNVFLNFFMQSSKHEDRKVHQVDHYVVEKPEKKERSSKTKDKREKGTDEEKELRKERKLGRKRVLDCCILLVVRNGHFLCYFRIELMKHFFKNKKEGGMKKKV